MSTNKELEKDLNDFKEKSEKDTKRILDVLETLAGGEVKQSEPVKEKEKVEEIDPQEFPVSKTHREIFEKHFDTEDGFIFATDYPERNRATVFVPKKLSNASEAHWAQYNNDIRSSKRLLDDFDEEMNTWLGMVVKNLRYDRNMVRKILCRSTF